MAVAKKDTDELRLCIDYRELNEHIVPLCAAIPRIDDLLLDAAGSNGFFSKLDAASGFFF